MQVNLVFSPFTITRVPLGIALIKSYVEKHSDCRVKCFDLNSQHHVDFVDDIRECRGHLRMSAENRADFLKAVATFENKGGEFFDQAAYNSSMAALFETCLDKMNSRFEEACKSALFENTPAPWFVDKYVEQLLSNRPDVVGFSMMFLSQFTFPILAAAKLKAANKNIKIVFGGNASTAVYRTLLRHPAIDFVVLNEGEAAFADLLSALRGDKELREVPNIAYRDAGDVRVAAPSVIGKLDDLPFADFSDFDLRSYFCPEPIVGILGSRGCYWRRCAFCVHHKSYFNRYRAASVERVVDELEYHVNNGVRYFDFVDEMIPASRFRQIAEEIIKRKLQLYYYALAKPTSDFTKETLEVMYRSGCRYIIWGVESGSQRVLDLIDKGTVVDDMATVLSDSASAGVKNHLFTIVGFPSETEQELEETMRFLYESRNSIHAIHSGEFQLYEGSPVYESPARFQIAKVYPDSAEAPGGKVKYDVSGGINAERAEQYKAFFWPRFFNRFDYFSRHLRTYRHHALFLYANDDKLVFNVDRMPIPDPEDLFRAARDYVEAALLSEQTTEP